MKENRRFCPRRWALLLMLLVLAMGLSAGARAEECVAKIDNAEYDSLRAALETVPSDNTNPVTIELTADVVLEWQSGDNALDVNKDNVVIDGNGHTISAGTSDEWKQYEVNGANPSFGSYKLIKVSGSNVTLKNMTVDGGETYRGVSCVTTVGGKNVTYEGITLKGRGSGHYYGIGGETITFKNCTIETHGYGINNSEGGNFTILIDGCTIHGWNSFAPAESVTIKDTTFYGASDEGRNGLLAKVRPYSFATLTNCKFSEEFIYDGGSEWCGIDTGKNDLTVVLNDCSVITEDGNASNEPLYKVIHDTAHSDTVYAIDATGDSTSGYTGGTFVTGNKDKIPVAAGYKATETDEQGVYTVEQYITVTEPASDEEEGSVTVNDTPITVSLEANTAATEVAFSDVVTELLDQAVNNTGVAISQNDAFTLGTRVAHGSASRNAADCNVTAIVEAHLEAYIKRNNVEVASADVSDAQLKDNASITFDLPVASAIDNAASAIKVTHFKDNGDTVDLGGFTIQGSGDARYVTVTVDSFSDFGQTATTDHTSDYSNAFTAALVPQANTVALNGTVLFDLKLSGTKTADINAMEFVLEPDSGLSVTNVTNSSGLTLTWNESNRNSIVFSENSSSNSLLHINANGEAVTIAAISVKAANPGENNLLHDGQELNINLSAGWIKVSDSTVKYDVSPTVTPGTVTLNQKVNVTYVYDNGSENSVEQSGYNCLVTEPENPERGGYTFVNWYQVTEEGAVIAVNATAFNFADTKILTDIILKAKWTPTQYNITYTPVDGVDYSGFVTTYNIKTGVTGTPTRNGYEFVGWQEDPVDANSNNPQWVDNMVYTTAETVGLYGDVRLKSVWKVDAFVAIADYAYAYNNGTSDADVLMVVKVASPVDGAAYYYGDNKLYTTNSAPYRNLVSVTDENTSVYVYLIDRDEVEQQNDTWVLKDVTKLTFKTNETNEAILRDGDVNRNSSVTTADWGIVGDMLRTNGAFFSRDFLSVRERLEADVNVTSGENTGFGSVDDIASIITKRSSINSN